ncbi:hypothetical protein AGMMS49928_18160 [Spirochaetia bacterium]|nr:hypothetical protein AGMMS49928_18160 [Spirochaetia bacterium]
MLDLPVREAAALLKTGDTAFILKAPAKRMGELSRISPSAPFYAGLLVRQADADGAETLSANLSATLSAALFKAALNSPNGLVRNEAARELILPLLEKKIPPEEVLVFLQDKKPYEISAWGAALFSLGLYEEIRKFYETNAPATPWDRAFLSLAILRVQEPETDYAAVFFEGVPGEACRWALEEGQKLDPPPLTGAETAAALGRMAAARSSFAEALRFFRITLEIEKDEQLFLRYPDLAGDLGRAFQFAGQGSEGLKLFTRWEAELAKNSDGDRDLHFKLLYYMGRMARQLGLHNQGNDFFDRALAFAPDALQTDACIWYILNSTVINRPETAAAQVKAYLPRWNDDAYFADILDRLIRYLVSKRQWKTLEEIFALIRPGNDGVNIAKCAWILGRAVEEGFITTAGGPAGGKTETADSFFKIAFEEGSASFYYRALAASRLGDSVTLAPDDPAVSGLSDDTEFFTGFFEYGGAAFVPAYFEEWGEKVPVTAMRLAAENFAAEGRWSESMRLAASYMGRPGYELNRRDLELNYPRPFRDLIEGNAEKAELSPAILYGLIRTESAFAPGISSRAGAVGLSQLMDATAREMAGRISRQGGPDYLAGDSLDLTDPGVNIHIGAYYLGYLMDRMGNPLAALLAYNGGMGRVRRWRAAEGALPEDLFLETIEYAETREYGRRVLAAAAAYGYLYYDMSMETVIADIFK